MRAIQPGKNRRRAVSSHWTLVSGIERVRPKSNVRRRHLELHVRPRSDIQSQIGQRISALEWSRVYFYEKGSQNKPLCFFGAFDRHWIDIVRPRLRARRSQSTNARDATNHGPDAATPDRVGKGKPKAETAATTTGFNFTNHTRAGAARGGTSRCTTSEGCEWKCRCHTRTQAGDG